ADGKDKLNIITIANISAIPFLSCLHFIVLPPQKLILISEYSLFLWLSTIRFFSCLLLSLSFYVIFHFFRCLSFKISTFFFYFCYKFKMISIAIIYSLQNVQNSFI